MRFFTKRSALLAVMLLLAVVGVKAEEFEVDGIRYSTDGNPDGEVTVSSVSNNENEIVIPSKVVYDGKEYEVTNIVEYAFSLRYDCTSVKLPSSIRSISPHAFEGCSKLKSISVSEQNPYYSSLNGVLYDEGKTTLYRVPQALKEVAIPSSVTDIAAYAFSECSSITSLTLPASLKSIREGAFYRCYGLTTLEIPASVTTIEFYAFAQCRALQSINVNKDNLYYSSIDGVVYNRDKTTLCYAPVGRLEIIVPSSVEKIGDFAFEGCNLTSLELPSSLTDIGDYAFDGCRNLGSLKLPSSLTSIGDYAFDFCTGLTEMEIPNSVTDMGDGVFASCYYLTSLKLSSALTRIGDHTFNRCYRLTSLEIPSNVTSIGFCAFCNCNALTSLEIPAGVTEIGESAFSSCSRLVSLDIPSSVTKIGDGAFSYCYNLQSINVDKQNLYYVSENGVVYNKDKTKLCHAPGGLAEIVVSYPVTSIANYAFDGCRNLGSLELPSSLTNIGKYAFSGCANLTSIVIPALVEDIDTSAFMSCTALQDVVFLSRNTDAMSRLEDELNDIYFDYQFAGRLYSTQEILDSLDVESAEEVSLLTISDVRQSGGTLAFSVTNECSDIMQIKALEIGGQRVAANESSRYSFEGLPEAKEYEMTVYADIYGTEYPVYLTINVQGGTGIRNVQVSMDGLQPEVGGNLSDGTARLRVAGEGGEARWTLTAVGGATVAQGRVVADGSWQRLEGVRASRGIYLLTVSDGQVAKTIKLAVR